MSVSAAPSLARSGLAAFSLAHPPRVPLRSPCVARQVGRPGGAVCLRDDARGGAALALIPVRLAHAPGGVCGVNTGISERHNPSLTPSHSILPPQQGHRATLLPPQAFAGRRLARSPLLTIGVLGLVAAPHLARGFRYQECVHGCARIDPLPARGVAFACARAKNADSATTLARPPVRVRAHAGPLLQWRECARQRPRVESQHVCGRGRGWREAAHVPAGGQQGRM